MADILGIDQPFLNASNNLLILIKDLFIQEGKIFTQEAIKFDQEQTTKAISFNYYTKFKYKQRLVLVVRLVLKLFSLSGYHIFFISMDQFSLQDEYDQIRFHKESESVIIYGNFIDDSPFLQTILSPEKSQNQTIQHLLNVNVFRDYELVNQVYMQQQQGKLQQRLDLSHQYANVNQLPQNILDSDSFKSVTDQSCHSKEKGQNKRKNEKKTQQNDKNKKNKKIKKQDKNQYDKNIPGHIVTTVVNQILKPAYKQQLQFYCKNVKNLSQNQHVSYFDVIEFAKKVKERSTKFGTSELGNFFCDKNPENDLQKVFGLFMVRFLRQQYLLHILRVGKMSNKQKYLECATNMMYIPRLRQEEYQLIHQFYRNDV